MSSRLPEPAPVVRRTLRLLPHEPGVYVLRDSRGRVVYVGRSRDIATRVRSYWIDLKDRPHLIRMLPRVEWIEPVICASEHEAAFLESDLLERHHTSYNRTLGMESRVWLRLDANLRRPNLDVVHEVRPGNGAEWFGPYLGWEPTSQAAKALLRLFPLRYAGSAVSRSDRELARSRGVMEGDAPAMLASVRHVLHREPGAVRGAIKRLEEIRRFSAKQLMFERAAIVHEQLRGLRWITQPQKLAALDSADDDFAAVGVAGGTVVRVVLSLRGGRLWQRSFARLQSPEEAEPRRHGPWAELAHSNANLMAQLAAANVVGPLGWN